MSSGPRFRAGLAKLRLLIVALSVVIVARLAVAAQRSRRLERHIVKLRDRAASPSRTLVHDLREIAWSVSATARLVPGATCLTQALAGDWLLARRGRTGEIQLSLPVGEASEGFRPHAWLICNGHIVLGGTQADYDGHRFFGAARG
ncbi:hypothetical protein LCGC14_0497770 [marine sediment metagenome]|uniref:Microcin J25-processing protein McjB C-terminal domain-containing protein n=1 Tax=marine sediment metagenome TaxID=412755 RepID=A0A0F9SNB1_9ZZZZ